jgi:hypothetical protein
MTISQSVESVAGTERASRIADDALHLPTLIRNVLRQRGCGAEDKQKRPHDDDTHRDSHKHSGGGA